MRIENVDVCAFSRIKTTKVTLQASVNSEPAIDLCMKKCGVKQHYLTPHSRKWGVSWPPWPRASAVYVLEYVYAGHFW